MTAFLPDRDVLETFTRELGAAIERGPPATAIDAEALAAAMKDSFEAAVAANREAIVDKPSELHLQRCSAILAGYRALSALVDDEAWTLAVLQDAVVAPRMATVREWLAERMGVDASAPDEAFAATSANFKARGDRVFGKAYAYEQEVEDEDRNFVNVTRCFFNDFFRRNEAPELTRLCCALDMLWADELNEGAYNVSFERPATLAEGDDCCRFQFSRKGAA
jgi:hypothetical protein